MISGILLVVFLISFGLTALLVRYRYRIGIIDMANSRSLHSGSMPRTGGMAVCAAIFVGFFWVNMQWNIDQFDAIAISLFVVAGTAFIDDLRSIPAIVRFLMQLVAGILLVNAGFLPLMLDLPGILIPLPLWLAWPMTLLFILWMTNLYNFMDGMDGFAGGMAVIGFAGMALLAMGTDHQAFIVINLVISLASAGFLFFNFPPARVFMGDLGSSILGFLAAVQILWAHKLQIFPLWAGILIFSPFIVDATWVLFRRLFTGKRLWDAHRSHFYQRLVLIGWSHRRTVIVEYVLMISVTLTAVRIVDVSVGLQIAILCVWGCLFAALMLLVRKRENRANDHMKLPERIRTPLAAFLHDLMMVPLAWLLAFALRFNLGSIPEIFQAAAFAWLPLIMAIQASAFVYLGLYRGVWRFASLPDLLRIIKAVVIGTCVSVIVIFLLVRLENIPRSVFPLYTILLITALGAPRFIYRSFKDRNLYQNAGQKVLIIGAGQAGEMLVRDLYRDRSNAYAPVGFVDDAPGKKGHEVHGVRVMGNCDLIPALIKEHEVDLVIIAVPSATSAQMQRVVAICEQTSVPFRILPCLDDLVAGRVTTQALREVSIDDLLGRESASLDWEHIRHGIKGKTILVTGGGGSIGSGLVREIAKLDPQALIILEQSEQNLYQIESELRYDFPLLDFYGRLVDITDKASVNHSMQKHKPDIVFHAAAYKHVPMLEGQVREAIKNNVLGTRIVAAAANKTQCEAFVLISTDKAVNPSNVMGACKRVSEIYCQNLNRQSATRFITVRFGNVLDSTGSVVPLFREQISRGGPVTVTHPEVERYFMTISEACQLILQAGSMGAGGEIFVLNMGQPVSIVYLAEQMIRLSGKVPGEDIDIVYTGLRPGEKLYEELFHKDEALRHTEHNSILLADYRPVDWEKMLQILENMEIASNGYDSRMLEHLLKQLVPEWTDEKQGIEIRYNPVIEKPEDKGKQAPLLH